MSPQLHFASSNAGKLREFEAWLGRPVRSAPLHLDELQSADLREVVTHKVHQSYEQIRQPVFVEDTALGFDAWKGLPGPFIRFFLESLGPAGLARVVLATGDAGADARSAIAYYDGRHLEVFLGRTVGQIVLPRGTRGFGWDPIFQPEGSTQSFAEMPLAEKQQHSMRARAAWAFAASLNQHLGIPGAGK